MFGAAVAFDYHATSSSAGAQRTELAAQFEREARSWLDHPRNVSDFAQAVAAERSPPWAWTATAACSSPPARRALQHAAAVLARRTQGAAGGDEPRARLALTPVRVDERSTGEKILASTGTVLQRAMGLLTVVVMALIVVYLVRQTQGSGGKAKLAERPTTRFDDVIGSAEAKAALQQVTAFMRDPQKYLALGAKPPRGVLLEGPSCRHRQDTARASPGGRVRRELHRGGRLALLQHVLWRGHYQGARALRDGSQACAVHRLHRRVRRHRQAFNRGQGGRGHSEENRIINKLLVEMDGFEASENVVVIGATNHVGNVDEDYVGPAGSTWWHGWHCPACTSGAFAIWRV